MLHATEALHDFCATCNASTSGGIFSEVVSFDFPVEGHSIYAFDDNTSVACNTFLLKSTTFDGVHLDHYRYLGFASSITGNNSPHESGVKPGPLAPANPIQAISLLQEFAGIKECSDSLTPPVSTSDTLYNIFRDIPFHVPEPILRCVCGVRGPAHCTLSNVPHNVDGND